MSFRPVASATVFSQADPNSTGIVDHDSADDDDNPIGRLSLQPPNSSASRAPHSPLKVFSSAKKKASDIFKETGTFVSNVQEFVDGVAADFFDPTFSGAVRANGEKVKAIGDIVGRNQMKVVFFGRTSNGKSSVVNAMLREKLLPTGLGHTTNCFIQVEGVNSPEGYILIEGSADPKSTKSISDLVNALSESKMDANSLIRIMWPKTKCLLLKEEVVLVDSPGVDISPDFDVWIDKHCLDADVFVFVSNSESTIMQTEKNFFIKVSNRLSKPQLFILNNRWDASAGEPETMHHVRRQHLERNITFLVDELKVVTRSEAENRVFFVSAKEAYALRLQKDHGIQPPMGVLQEGYAQRCMEFDEFERRFEECISHSAVQTKFEQHVQCGKALIAELRRAMESTFEKTLAKRNELAQRRQNLVHRIEQFDKNVLRVQLDFKKQVAQVGEEVNRLVSSALCAEIRRLPTHLEEFERPFHPDPAVLAVFKREIIEHVEGSLARNLRTRCSGPLLGAVEELQKHMADGLGAIIPSELRQQFQNEFIEPVLLAATSGGFRDLSIIYAVDCRSLCGDFREDIEFHFSLGLTNLTRKIFGSKTSGSFLGHELLMGNTLAESNDKSSSIAPLVLSSAAAVVTRSAVGVLLIGIIIYKSIGVKVLAIGGALYGGLYGYELLTWTTKAKERAFKRQFAGHCGAKLQQVADLTSAGCSHQVQQHVQATWGQLLSGTTRLKDAWETELQEVCNKTSQVEEANTTSKLLRNRAGWLDGEFTSFVNNYLTSG